jgi:threonine efflux protein
MTPFSLLLPLFAVDFLAAVSPGPAFVMVTQMSARHGTRSGLAAVAGLIVACWVWCAVVLSGLTILFQVVPWLYAAIKVAGGAYLAWIGLMHLRGGPAPHGRAGNGAAGLTIAQSFRKGLWVGLTNPKAIVYFGSIFTLFLKPGSPLWLDAAAVGIVTFDCAVWYGFVGVLFSRPAVRRLYDRLQRRVEQVAGAVMLAFGLKLILSKG